MAFTANALEPDDWQDEAELAAVVPFAPPQASTRAWVLAPSSEEIAELRKQIAVKETATKMLNERLRKLAAEGTARAKHIAELEAQLLAAREDLAHRENENRSLQTSLDLSVVEGARLSGRLWDSGVESDTLRTRLDTLKTTLLASEAERDRLKTAMQETSDLHRIEADALNSQIEAMVAQTAAAETMLADTRKSLVARTEESNEAGRKAAGAARERDVAAALLGELQRKLKAKDHQIRELDESRNKLMAQTGSLLEAFEARATALAEAEAKVNALARQVDSSELKSALAQRQVESLTAKLQSHESALAEAAEAVQSLAKRIADAEAKSCAAESETERLTIKMWSHEVALAEASDSVQMLAGRAAAAETKARTVENETTALNEKIQSQQGALAEAADSVKSLTERAATAEAGAQAAESKIEGLNLELQQEQARRAIAEVAFAKVQTESVRLRRQVETLTTRNRELEAIQQRAREAIKPVVLETAAPQAAPEPAAVGAAIFPAASSLSARSLLAETVSL
jgi:chromosome segregation ATPase